MSRGGAVGATCASAAAGVVAMRLRFSDLVAGFVPLPLLVVVILFLGGIVRLKILFVLKLTIYMKLSSLSTWYQYHLVA